MSKYAKFRNPRFIGCSLSQKDTDEDGITDDIDVCPDTPENYPVLADGCTDESAKEIDWDEDGYTGDDDEFMFEPTQWADSDGDGYGDNPEGVDGDQCPQVSGNSTEDRLGCLDTDSDGYSDPTLISQHPLVALLMLSLTMQPNGMTLTVTVMATIHQD